MALEQLGPYKFQGILGRGGMGTVYRGQNQETGEFHAVKVLAPTYAHDAHFRGRFESEIKALIKLDHPNIVRLLSYGQADGMLFFSMELVEGNSLYQMQKKGHRFDWREVLSIARDVSKGLRHAHDRGIIHRDLKPGNLLMMPAEKGAIGTIKITDFGIAKRFGNSQNTGDNVLGTMDFMSPEQAKGEPVTIRSDLYSLGTVMFTLLSGKPPFTANSVEESLRNLTRVPAPSVSTVVPEVPPELDELIRKLMAKRPEKRIPTAQALLHRIDDVETRLRDSSEAQTKQRPAPQRSDETFDVGAPRTKASTEIGDRTKQTNDAEHPHPTVPHTRHLEEDESSPPTKIDYFNTVTDQVRKRQDVVEVEGKSDRSGIWLISLALLAVVLIASYGVYRAYKPPTAEALYAQIEQGSDRPAQILEEMSTFLQLYPDDARAVQVAELQRIGDAIYLYNSLSNTLTVRQSVKGDRLSEIEKQFLNIVELSDDNPAQANAKMTAFITVHANTDNLSERDQKCIQAAAGYQIKIENTAREKVRFDLKQIRSAMTTAAEATDPDRAIPIYRSILKLYENVDWGIIDEADEGRALVSMARSQLQALEAEQSKLPKPDPEKQP